MGMYAPAERTHKRRPAVPGAAARALFAPPPNETGPADRPTLGETLNDSPRVTAQLRIGRALNEGPRAVAQARLAAALAPPVRLDAGTAPPPPGPALQAVWVETAEEPSAAHKWDEPLDGVTWYADEGGLMWFRITNEGQIAEGTLEDYESYAGQKKTYDAWARLYREAASTGLAMPAMVSAYAEAVARINRPEWQTLAKEPKVKMLVDLANSLLSKTGTPHAAFDFVKLAPGTAGLFDHGKWTISFNELRFDPEFTGGRPTDMAELTDTVYHESRHAEQWFRVARLLAGDGMKAAAIGDATGIEVGRVLGEAERAPLSRKDASSREVREAVRWEASLIGSEAYRTGVKFEMIKAELSLGGMKGELLKLKALSVVIESEFKEINEDIEDIRAEERTYDEAARNLTLWAEINKKTISIKEKMEEFEQALGGGGEQPELDESLLEMGFDPGPQVATTEVPVTVQDWREERRFWHGQQKEAALKLQGFQQKYGKVSPTKLGEQRLKEHATNKEQYDALKKDTELLYETYKKLHAEYETFVEERDAFEVGRLAKESYEAASTQLKREPGHSVVQMVNLAEEGEREKLLDIIEQTEGDTLFSSGAAERARDYVLSLQQQQLEEVGAAVDAVERYVLTKQAKKSDDSDEENLDEPLEQGEQSAQEATAAKVRASKARLLVMMANGDVTPAALNQRAGAQENKYAKSEIKGLAESVLDEDISEEEYREEFADELDKAGLGALAEEVGRVTGGLRFADMKELIVRRKGDLFASDSRERLKKSLLPLVRKAESLIRQSGNPKAAQNVREFKTWLLYDFFAGKEPVESLSAISNEGTKKFIAEKSDFITERAEFLSGAERTPEEIREAFGQDVSKRQQEGYKEALAEQEADRKRLGLFVEQCAKSEPVGSVLRNSCEWLLARKAKIYAQTRTHDSDTRALAVGAPNKDAWFPNPDRNAGDVFGPMEPYSLENNDNVMFRPKNTQGGSTQEGSVVINAPSKVSDEVLKRTIVHEVQHSADYHPLDPLSRYQSEVNAYLLGHREGAPEDFLKNVNPQAEVADEYGTWGAEANAVYRHMTSSKGYDYLTSAWEENQEDFRKKLVAIRGPYTPNPVNSVRIDHFNKALKAVSKSDDFEDGQLADAQKREGLDSAFRQLTEGDLAALKGNRATLDLLERHLLGVTLEEYKNRLGLG